MRCPMLAAFLDLCPAFGTFVDLHLTNVGGRQDTQEYIQKEKVLYRVSQKKWCIAISNSRVVLDDQRLIKLTDT